MDSPLHKQSEEQLACNDVSHSSPYYMTPFPQRFTHSNSVVFQIVSPIHWQADGQLGCKIGSQSSSESNNPLPQREQDKRFKFNAVFSPH